MSRNEDWGLLTADRGAAFAAEIEQTGPRAWRASARVSIIRLRNLIDQTVGPRTFDSEGAARDWLTQQATSHGFANIAVAVRRLDSATP